jgi:DNA-3-methyladenine glycosylase I
MSEAFSHGLERCPWPGADPLYRAYHDHEWGVPEWDDRALFEKLVLDGQQAGLSWITILRKREGYRRAYDGFDPERIAAYGRDKMAALMADPGIVRNRAKITAATANARAYLALREEMGEGGFARFLWQFTGERVIQNAWTSLDQAPAETAESRAMSRSLSARGFKFCGPVICYAFMQAVGMVNDHLVTCFRHRELGAADAAPLWNPSTARSDLP